MVAVLGKRKTVYIERIRMETDVISFSATGESHQ